MWVVTRIQRIRSLIYTRWFQKRPQIKNYNGQKCQNENEKESSANRRVMYRIQQYSFGRHKLSNIKIVLTLQIESVV